MGDGGRGGGIGPSIHARGLGPHSLSHPKPLLLAPTFPPAPLLPSPPAFPVPAGPRVAAADSVEFAADLRLGGLLSCQRWSERARLGA